MVTQSREFRLTPKEAKSISQHLCPNGEFAARMRGRVRWLGATLYEAMCHAGMLERSRPPAVSPVCNREAFIQTKFTLAGSCLKIRPRVRPLASPRIVPLNQFMEDLRMVAEGTETFISQSLARIEESSVAARAQPLHPKDGLPLEVDVVRQRISLGLATGMEIIEVLRRLQCARLETVASLVTLEEQRVLQSFVLAKTLAEIRVATEYATSLDEVIRKLTFIAAGLGE